MDGQLIVAILFAFVFLPLHLSFSRKLQKHVKENYPNEWEKVSSNKMKMNIKSIRPVALNDSLKYGFLSQQNDPVLTRFLNHEKVSNFIGLALIAGVFLLSWLQ